MTNDLHMKILLCECKMSFKIGSLSFVKDIDKKSTYYPLHPPPPPPPLPPLVHRHSFCGDKKRDHKK